MKFADIICNKEGIDSLRLLVDSNKIPHALLLSGSPGIGKMMTARAFIAYINCTNHTPDGDSCGVCPNCRQIDSLNHPDIHFIYPIYKNKTNGKIISSDYIEEWRRFLKESPYMDYPLWVRLMNSGNSQPQISVEEAADISSEAALSTFSAKYKIFLIWLPEKMNPQASNRLLKLIEEPHPDTLFICVSNDPGSILPTIYSRLQRIELRRPADGEIYEALKTKGMWDEKAAVFARLSEGSVLKALQFSELENENEEFSHIFRDVMRNAFSRKVVVLKNQSDRLADFGREKIQRLLDYFARMTRENFMANLRVPSLNVMTQDEQSFSSNFAPFINSTNVEDILRNIDSAKRDINRNANAKLVWFDFFINIMMLIRKK